VEPLGEFEFSQLFLYGEAITDLDAFIEAVADEKANGAELVDITLTSLPTGRTQPSGATPSEPVMVLTFRYGPAGQRAEEEGVMHTGDSFPVSVLSGKRTLPRPQSSLVLHPRSDLATLGSMQVLAEVAPPS
jgi:hypothetical protein